MEDAFIEELGKAVMFIRKRDLKQLGNSAIVQKLFSCVEKSLPKPIDECSPVMIGDLLLEIFNQAIEKLKPSDVSLDSPARRIYVFFTEYILSGKELHIVASDILHVSRSTFYDIQNLALQQLATILWHFEREAKMNTIVLNNLEQATYYKYIERFDEKGLNFITNVIIPELKEGRAWIIALKGRAGIGKSAIAYALAEEIINKRNKYLLPFQAVIWFSCRRDEFQYGTDSPKVIEKSATMTSFFETIATTLEDRNVLQCNTDEGKQEIVEKLLKQKVCLIVLDNLDSAWVTEIFKDEIKEYIQRLPRPHKILVTMREDDYWTGQATIKAIPMYKNEAWEFLHEESINRHIIPPTESEFGEIYEKTFGTPLAMKQVLGLIRINGYTLDQALDFEKHVGNMLEFMFEKAYKRLSIPTQKVFQSMFLFADPASSEALAYAANIQEIEKVDALGRLFRGNLIEKVLIQENSEYRYVLLPFISEYLRKLRNDPSETVGDKSLKDFVLQATNRMIDYYIKVLEAFSNEKEVSLLILKTEKNTILSVMKWVWEAKDEKFIKLFDLVGINLGILRYLEIRETFGRRAVELCEQIGKKREANWYLIRDVAWTVMQKGTTTARSEVRDILSKALKDAEKENWESNKALALFNQARLSMDNGSNDEANINIDKALSLWQKSKDDFWKNLTLIAKGRLLVKEREFDKASQIFEDLENKFIQNGYLNGRIEVISELAIVRAKQGNCEEAQKLAETSKIFAESISPPSFSLAYALSNYSIVKEICGDMQKAIFFADEAMKIYNAMGVKYHADKLKDRIDRLLKKLNPQ